jgi:hypothetical protein
MPVAVQRHELGYVNAAGLDRLKRGGSTPYPDGTHVQ